jgi:uncharacterized protein YcbK (DUF882 family)
MQFLNVKYFTSDEFDSPDLPGSGVQMDLHFVRMLDLLRNTCGFPFKITSGFRTIAHNKAIGGESESAHLDGLAADIAAINPRVRYLIVSYAIRAGFTRIGIGDTFVHLDLSPKLDQEVIWIYKTGETRSL